MVKWVFTGMQGLHSVRSADLDNMTPGHLVSQLQRSRTTGRPMPAIKQPLLVRPGPGPNNASLMHCSVVLAWGGSLQSLQGLDFPSESRDGFWAQPGTLSAAAAERLEISKFWAGPLMCWDISRAVPEIL